MNDFKIASGRLSKDLAEHVADCLEIKLTPVESRNFSDGEIWVKFSENVRGVDLFIIQSTVAPADNLMELLIMIDAAKRASASRVTAVIPYFGYARQDRKDQPRVSVTAKLIANLISRAGADRVLTLDLHSSQIQGFFDIPLDHLYASTVFLKALAKLELEDLAIAAPDVGGVKTARAYAKRMNGDLVLVDKRRPAHNKAEIVQVIGEVKGKNIIIVDDMIDTGNSFIQCAEALKDKGAKDIIGVCVHAVFSGNAVGRIDKSDAIKKMYITDSIPLKNTIGKN